ncbi:uncharacterized protein LOC116804289 [Drosophila mojavensis]|uniref:uncharacterized protein LOC116804289 n=1 Tax=Drosophila mojavensis TaxID=7230 RepID=UPI0013EE9272|nr:uncharacterized protein LOC116804289 [Drosophila mojavensis]
MMSASWLSLLFLALLAHSAMPLQADSCQPFIEIVHLNEVLRVNENGRVYETNMTEAEVLEQFKKLCSPFEEIEKLGENIDNFQILTTMYRCKYGICFHSPVNGGTFKCCTG